MLRWLVSVSAVVMAATIFYVSRPLPITGQAATELVATCLKDNLERCSVKDDSSWAALSDARFRLIRTADPQLEIANFDFVSLDGRYCAFVQFGKGDLSFVRTAEFYRCANRSKVAVGVG
jgi:hypothetical protein